MDWIQMVILSLIQGITEFLPISSSAHLILPAQLTRWPDQGLAFDVGVHCGTLFAVLLYFRRDLINMAVGSGRGIWQQRYNPELDLVLKLGLATVPVAVCGFLAKDFIEAELRTVPVIAATTIIFAVVLWWADRRPQENTGLANPGWIAALLIGLAQILALVPGTSRSGVTISAALILGLGRVAGARFSFLLAIPTIAGAQLLLMLDLASAAEQQRWLELICAAAISGVSAYLCIRFFIALVERTGMLPYVVYRLLLGTVLWWLYVSGWQV